MRSALLTPFLLVLLSGYSLATSVTIRWSSAADSNAHMIWNSDVEIGTQANGKSVTYPRYCSLNGTRFPFRFHSPRAYSDLNTDIHAGWVRGLPDRSLIKLGLNVLACEYVMHPVVASTALARAGKEHGDWWVPIRGAYEARFYLNEDTNFRKELSNTYKWAGDQRSATLERRFWGGGLRPIELSLTDLDPGASGELDGLQARGRSLLTELERLRRERPSVEELDRKLGEISHLNFNEISVEAIRSISNDLTEIETFVTSLKNEIEAVRAEQRNQLNSAKSELDRLNKLTVESLSGKGYEISEFSQPLDGLLVSQGRVLLNDLPLLIDSGALFSDQDNLYEDVANITIQKLKEALNRRNRFEFNSTVESWTRTQGVLSTSLDLRSGIVSTHELKAFNRASARTIQFINTYVDDFGFFKDLGLPPDIRDLVKNQLAKFDEMKARRLRDSLNEWEGGPNRSREQLLALEMIRHLDPLYEAAQEESGARLQAALEGVNSLVEKVIQHSGMVARAGVSFTPAGDVIDFCELVTGAEDCLPGGKELSAIERAVSVLGLVGGTAKMWRKFASLVKGKKVARAAEETAELVRATVEANRIAVDEAVEILLKDGGILTKEVKKELQALAAYDKDGLLYAVSKRTFNSGASRAPKKAKNFVSREEKGWGTVFPAGKWTGHFEDHRFEFGVATREEYLKLARKFIHDTSDLEIVRRIDTGTFILFSPQTGRIAFVDSDGLIGSFYDMTFDNIMRRFRLNGLAFAREKWKNVHANPVAVEVIQKSASW